MNNKVLSYSSRTASDLKSLLTPTVPQLLLNLVLAALILLVLNSRAILHYFTKGIDENSKVELGDLISSRLPAVYDLFESLTQGRFVQFVFWLFIGCITYIFIWLLGNFITNIRNDIVADEYVHPQSYNRAGYWGSVVARKMLFVCTLFVLSAYVYVGAKLIILLAGLCYQSAIESQWLNTSGVILGSLLVTAFVLQVFSYLYTVVVNAWKIVYKDL